MRIEEVIGEHIARLRKKRGWTQTELAGQLTEWLPKPWTRQAVWAAEQGKRVFIASELIVFAYILETTVEGLMRPPLDHELVDLPGGRSIDVLNLLEAGLAGASQQDELVQLQESVSRLAALTSDANDEVRDLGETVSRFTRWFAGGAV